MSVLAWCESALRRGGRCDAVLMWRESALVLRQGGQHCAVLVLAWSEPALVVR